MKKKKTYQVGIEVLEEHAAVSEHDALGVDLLTGPLGDHVGDDLRLPLQVHRPQLITHQRLQGGKGFITEC